MAIYTKYTYAGGSQDWVPVKKAWCMKNGVWKEVTKVYKTDKDVLQILPPVPWFWLIEDFTSSSGTNELDSIEITNDYMSSDPQRNEYRNNLWGKGDNKDVNGVFIGYYTVSSGGSLQHESFSCLTPKYNPILNVSNSWLQANNITISGSTSSIKSKKFIQKNSTDSGLYNSAVQKIKDNVNVSLNNNGFFLSSNEPSGRESGKYISRKLSNSDGICVGYEYWRYNRSSSGGGSWSRYEKFEWSIEILVNFAMTFTHTPSGESRTVTKVIRYVANY